MEVPVEAKGNSATGGVGKLVDLEIKAGDILLFRSDKEDQWSILEGNNSYSINANGLGNHLVNIGEANQSFLAGALVGSFDDGKTFFSIGLFSQLTVLVGGNNPSLKLYCADSDKDNNSGFIRVSIDKFSS
ncbi:hypothetical protein DS884_10380 [Tenacibaculum sp. E3R01]|uniref:hypothetical protein n=1 Tax=Tenacibaculum sp. E3R01 TaxID=2267227 RepID=UPI000DEB4E9D|nr:hypothetical protein [Tenacibaculum sp. E3R01]RBW58254.1 hypothetical protein DS884_10380 [Tenacibaculum sp. E3R01]